MSSGGATNVPGNADTNPEYRLPTDVYPEHYELVVKTDLAANPPSYSGELIVTLDVKKDTSSLVFNMSKSLNITHTAITTSDLKSSSSVVLSESDLTYNEKNDRGTLNLSSLPGGGLKAGQKDVKVWFRFDSVLAGNMVGYYLSEGDKDEKTGEKPKYALTQFEPTAARKAFPCWDEPLLKSKYTISMIAREHETVLSNMPEVESKAWQPARNANVESALSSSYQIGSLLDASSKQSEGKTEQGAGGEWKVTKFETTPLISSYLVAYACGVFASLSSEHHSKKTGKTVPLRIFATPNLIKQAQFGLDVKKWALPVYEEIFDIPYALPKLDTLVAHDFDAGAMENWGLITGRTTAYLIDPEKSSLAARKRVADVQCHELAHMWFGDIVTMKWWDNLWLNEAFATIMGELVIPDRIWPEWKPRQSFLDTHLTRALNLDSQRSSHAIEVDCPDAGKINQIFDAISYSKGASVLRMLSGVVGEDKFLKGVSIYLKKHLYSNATTKDLWDGISESSGLDVAKIMANWTLKVGFPIINVEEQGDGKLKLTQNRFLSTGDAKPEEDETLWWVPLEVKTLSGGKSSVDHKAIMHERSTTYDVGSAEDFKLNADTIGVYRVNYSPERLAKLGKQAKSFTVEDRVGLVSDAATLARAGYGKTSGSLSLISEIAPSENEFLVWSQISGALAKLGQVWWEQPENVRNAIMKLRADVFRPMVQKLGYDNKEGDAPDVKELRACVINAAAAAEEEEVVKELRSRFDHFMKTGDDSRIPPDIQRNVFSTAIQFGGSEEWEKVLSVYHDPPNPSTKVDAMYSLCTARKDELLERTFKLLDDGEVKLQDVYIFVIGLGSNEFARRRTGDWYKKNYDKLFKDFGETYGMTYLVKGSFSYLASEKDYQDVEAFFKDKDTSAFNLAVSQTLDSIQAATQWLKRDATDVEEWLKSNKYM
ncbi:leucyl aminopeptidase [Kockovaella imperatae]|uniref:Aminopeptidase n=1 Tax=Kockovaella imperatae TaxID=4999 RepID=A0A1Y1U6U5_9TREE|nr:leucyl aminopeptidase [Kockovaella imperatae]ORX33751.1 leucyl aminopeptidase [Kockovaella imperatae]